MSDDPTISPGGPESVASTERAAGPQQRQDVLPSLAQDRSVLAWLHQSTQLSPAATGYLCDALLQWAMVGLPWPEETEPAAGPDGDHLEVLRQISARLLLRIDLAPSLSAKLELGRIGGLLRDAIWSQLDPEAVRESQARELLHRSPWLADQPAPVVFADGRVL